MENSAVWHRRYGEYVDPAFEKSAFIIFVEFCSDTTLTPSEVGGLVKQRWLLKPSIFHISRDVAQELGRALGLDLAQWMRAWGDDILNGRPGKRVFVTDLRYCLSCLAKGHHSTLFQLPQVVQCPIHHELLKMGCPRCSRPIATNAFALARNHLYCGECDRNFATERRRRSVGGAIVHPLSEQFLALRHVIVTGPPPREIRSSPKWGKLPNEIAGSRILTRLYHAHTVWGDPVLGGGFLKLRTHVQELDTEGQPVGRAKYFNLMRGAMIDSFEELAKQLGRDVQLKDISLRIEGAVRSAARLDLRAPIVAAAFWQAASALGVLRFVMGEMPPPAAKDPPYSYWFPDHVGAMRVVVQHAVRVLFSHCLIRIRLLKYGVQVSWANLPTEAEFLPPWRLIPSKDPSKVVLELRTRADCGTLERLVTRYRRRWLLDAPGGDLSILVLGQPSGAPGDRQGAEGASVGSQR